MHESRYVVKLNDTLQSIAVKYYGDAKYWNEIYQINRASIGRGGSLQLGQVLIVPKLKIAEAGSDTPKSSGVTEVSNVKQMPSQVLVQPIAASLVQPISVKPAVALSQPSVVQVQTAPLVALSTAAVKQAREKKGIHKTALPGMASGVALKPAAPEPVEEAKPEPEKKRFEGPRKHTVAPGENLRIIAQKYYNDAERWRDIYKANKDKIVGGQIMPGMEITIP
jgi:nucleoid-associated protein YgaU